MKRNTAIAIITAAALLIVAGVAIDAQSHDVRATYHRAFCDGARATGTLDPHQAVAITIAGRGELWRCAPTDGPRGLPPAAIELHEVAP